MSEQFPTQDIGPVQHIENPIQENTPQLDDESFIDAQKEGVELYLNTQKGDIKDKENKTIDKIQEKESVASIPTDVLRKQIKQYTESWARQSRLAAIHSQRYIMQNYNHYVARTNGQIGLSTTEANAFAVFTGATGIAVDVAFTRWTTHMLSTMMVAMRGARIGSVAGWVGTAAGFIAGTLMSFWYNRVSTDASAEGNLEQRDQITKIQNVFLLNSVEKLTKAITDIDHVHHTIRKNLDHMPSHNLQKYLSEIKKQSHAANISAQKSKRANNFKLAEGLLAEWVMERAKNSNTPREKFEALWLHNYKELMWNVNSFDPQYIKNRPDLYIKQSQFEARKAGMPLSFLNQKLTDVRNEKDYKKADVIASNMPVIYSKGSELNAQDRLKLIGYINANTTFGTGYGKQGDYMELDIKGGSFKLYLTIKHKKNAKTGSREVNHWVWHLISTGQYKKDEEIQFKVYPK